MIEKIVFDYNGGLLLLLLVFSIGLSLLFKMSFIKTFLLMSAGSLTFFILKAIIMGGTE